MKKFLVLTLVFFVSFYSIGQKPHRPNPYRIAGGVGYNPKLVEPYLLSLKFYMKSGNAFELIGYNMKESWRGTLLFNPYTPLSKDGRFRFVIGPGVHVGWWKEDYKKNNYASNPIVGVDGIVGFEYRIPKLPICVQGHYQPSIDFAGNNEFFYDNQRIGAVVRIAL